MIRHKTAVLTAVAALGTAAAAAAPASAGGIGDFLSPAFGTFCGNHNTGARMAGATTHGTGAANGNIAGLPIGSALNQCGGADLRVPLQDEQGCTASLHQKGALPRTVQSALQSSVGDYQLLRTPIQLVIDCTGLSAP
jgi:hypothetical protein